jgi:hypothetical protein
MKTIFAALTAMAALTVITSSTAQSQSIETLQTRCSQKTLTYNKEGAKIGDAPDGYCLGFLEGTFTAMQRAKLICPDSPTDGPLLLSAFIAYAADDKLKGVDAADAIAAAYQRAYPCKK